MKIALFLCLTFWTAGAAAQTTLAFVGSPNSDYERLSATLKHSDTLWDFTALRTEAGLQGIAGARASVPLVDREHYHLSISPGFYAVFGERKELFGSGLGLGWEGEWRRLITEGLIVQYISPAGKSLSHYTIGEGICSFRLRRGFYATGGGEVVHNHAHAPRSIAWGGGVAYHFTEWSLFVHSRGHEVQLGLSWHKKKSL